MTYGIVAGESSPEFWSILREVDDFGLKSYDLLRAPGRFWADARLELPTVRSAVDAARAELRPGPLHLLRELPSDENWQAMTRRSVAQLLAWFLVLEDPQRRLEAQPIAALAHQASLVQHVLTRPELQYVLIADEVGLGKTVEAALIVKHILEEAAGLRVLYLAPARLVRNVKREFERLGLRFRIWVAGADRDAKLDDRRVIASIHRAVHNSHFDDFVASGSWDVIIVDECHHLTDWAPGGGSPTRRYKLVDSLRKQLGSGSRLILMSGTPHQGHAARFQNVLQLLRRDDESTASIRGRVIYRTKDDVRDWDGNPLFPRRQVNPPLAVDLGPAHRKWLEHIHALFTSDQEPTAGQARRRAVGWRCGQALQWATSSIQAGLGFLVRQAIRVGWTLETPGLRQALLSLRPYRQGSPEESPESLLERIRREIGQQQVEGDVEDIEDEEVQDTSIWRPNEAMLAALLNEGVALLEDDPDAKWRFIRENILGTIGDEKVVLFAQPIETVIALAGYLQRLTGTRPALIIGNQSEEERTQEIEAFWRDNGPQYLVSSRAGGEGLNLQIARRLIHVDVPWNPMELEQRVGRIHRFLSRRTILVDTVVVKDSREVDAYAVAHDKLRQIAQSMVPKDRMEEVVARVMALVPPEELQEVLTKRALGPLNEEERRHISAIVTAGFESWRHFHDQYADQQQKIRALDAGAARWDDLERFAVTHLGAKRVDGFSALRFRWEDGEVVAEDSESARALQIGNAVYSCGDYQGMPVTSADGTRAEPLGLNVPAIAEELRSCAFPSQPSGAAYLRWPDRQQLPAGLELPFALLAVADQSVRSSGGRWLEAGAELRMYAVSRQGPMVEIEGSDRGELMRALLDAVVRREPAGAVDLFDRLETELGGIVQSIRQPSEEDRATGTRHAVFPLLAAIITD